MKTVLATVALVAASLVSSVPAHAQGRDRVLIIYGDERCPTSNGEEIVVCVRKPASEQFRIPEELRNSGSGLPPSWNEKAKSIEYVGSSGIGSCSPTGPGGASGCLKQMIDAARAERRAQSAAEDGERQRR
ncbi:hypothetical protein [Sphingomonas quercus]|uniref:Uncharacterized protein n=1 Tax=Sphingomonas quercus TaxID=2842451 RepID=A0ABS6BI51_9SPHN|nr:hypothetical protein [Sphingomonas quercus]MBU3077986.1 hypothetical protein [Sphingomonas quercus]